LTQPIPNSLYKTLECPVSEALLTRAVSLAPCAHKINKEIARKIFGGMMDSICFTQAPCPLCKKTVTAYYDDPTIREIVKIVFPDIDQTKFPGESGVFHLSVGRWHSTFKTDSSFGRLVYFESNNPNSLFSSISVNEIGHKASMTVNINRTKVTHTDSNQVLKDYLMGKELYFEDLSYLTGTLFIQSKDEMQKMLPILQENNSFSLEDLERLRLIAKDGDWRNIPIVGPPSLSSHLYLEKGVYSRSGDWFCETNSRLYNREVHYTSQTPNSLFSKISVYDTGSGTKMEMYINPTYQMPSYQSLLKLYLADTKLQFDETFYETGKFNINLNEFKETLSLIMQHCSLPSDRDFKLLRHVMIKKHWGYIPVDDVFLGFPMPGNFWETL
jgi:hypothetical protein